MRRMISLVSGLLSGLTFCATAVAVLADDTPTGRVGLLAVACTAVISLAVVSVVTWAAPDMRAVGAAIRQAQRGQQRERTQLRSIR